MIDLMKVATLSAKESFAIGLTRKTSIRENRARGCGGDHHHYLIINIVIIIDIIINIIVIERWYVKG